MSERMDGDSSGNVGLCCGTPLDRQPLQVQRFEAIGLAAGGIAHDFKNLLTVAQGYVEVAISQCQKDEAIAAYLDKAYSALLRSKGLMDQLSHFSKVGKPQKKPLNVSRILRNAVNFAVGESNIKTSFMMDKDLSSVLADEGQIVQVIQNIVSNARHAMPAGGVIEAAAENTRFGPGEHSVLGDANYVRVSITDHGVGIPPDHMPKIFDPFFTTKQGCSGLGLSLSYFIIKNHHGHIEVASQRGAGTICTFYLPAAADQDVRGESGGIGSK